MKIILQCKCGASTSMEDSTFIIPGGSPDPNGRIFHIERRADRWLEWHERCYEKEERQ